MIFSEKIDNVDDITEYLLLKGVSVMGLHGQKSIFQKNNLFYKIFFRTSRQSRCYEKILKWRS